MHGKVAVCLLGFLLAPAFSATLTTYNNRTLFEGALSAAPTLVDFEGIVAPNSFHDYSNASGFSSNGATFVGLYSTGYTLLIQQGGQYDWGTGAVLRGAQSMYGGYFSVTFPSSKAVGFNLMTSGPGGSFVITMPAAVGGNTYNVNTNATQGPNPTWFGVTSDVAFTSIQIAAGGSNSMLPLLDNFEFGTTSAAPADTPEIATMIMIGLGLAALRAGRRYSRATPA